MDHRDHVKLLRDGVDPAAARGVWADFGAGTGAFTLALAELLGDGAEIHAVDRDERALRANAEDMRRRFPGVGAVYHYADFSREIELPPLDGFVMANSLHFQKHQADVVARLAGYLKPGGRVLIVEYNIEHGNFAVPHPVPFQQWERLAAKSRLERTRLLRTRPSRFLKEIYSAVCFKAG